MAPHFSGLQKYIQQKIYIRCSSPLLPLKLYFFKKLKVKGSQIVPEIDKISPPPIYFQPDSKEPREITITCREQVDIEETPLPYQEMSVPPS